MPLQCTAEWYHAERGTVAMRRAYVGAYVGVFGTVVQDSVPKLTPGGWRLMYLPYNCSRCKRGAVVAFRKLEDTVSAVQACESTRLLVRCAPRH